MPARAVALSLAVVVLLAAVTCKKDAPPPAAPADVAAAPAVVAAPTKDEVVTLLRTIDARLSERNYAGMETLFGIPTGFTADQLAENLAGLQERGEISASGIDALAERGTFGPAAEVLGADRAARFAEKFGVAVDRCHALALDPGEVVVCRFPDGVSRLIRLDDVGRVQ